MIGLRSNFGNSLVLAGTIFLLTGAAAFMVARRQLTDGRPWPAPTARILTVGSILVTIAATALPTRFALAADGDLVLQFGRAGLAEWRRAFADPLELPSIQFFSNVLLYVPTGFVMVFGWYRRRHLVPIVCLGLSVSIETIQFLALGRVASLDDVVLNVSGAVAGYLAAIGLARLRKGQAINPF